jgi:hypothetical protein
MKQPTVHQPWPPLHSPTPPHSRTVSASSSAFAGAGPGSGVRPFHPAEGGARSGQGYASVAMGGRSGVGRMSSIATDGDNWQQGAGVPIGRGQFPPPSRHQPSSTLTHPRRMRNRWRPAPLRPQVMSAPLYSLSSLCQPCARPPSAPLQRPSSVPVQDSCLLVSKATVSALSGGHHRAPPGDGASGAVRLADVTRSLLEPLKLDTASELVDAALDRGRQLAGASVSRR